MAIHILDRDMSKGEYGSPEIRAIWNEKAIWQDWINFEVTLAEVQAELGMSPADMAREIKNKGQLETITPRKLVEHYKTSGLGTVAMIRAFKDVCEGGAGEYIHYGATTQDVLDTTLALRLKKTLAIFERDLITLHEILCDLADKYRHAVMPGITQGQHAVPVTFGFVCAMWAQTMMEHVERLRQARPRICVGEISGAAGNFSSYHMLFGDKCWEMQKRILERMGLGMAPISMKPRNERLNEYMYLLAQYSATFEKIADDIFLQQRNEFSQLEEPHDAATQISSSTMPHKRNPVRCGTIKALATKLRFNAGAFAELHMRDLRDMSAFVIEDFELPETAVIMDTILKSCRVVLAGLIVRPDTMRRNLDLTEGALMTEQLALSLARKTGKKDTAMRCIHKAVEDARNNGVSLARHVMDLPELLAVMSREEIAAALNPENYLGLNDFLIANVTGSRLRQP